MEVLGHFVLWVHKQKKRHKAAMVVRFAHFFIYLFLDTSF